MNELLGKAEFYCSIHGEAKVTKVELFPVDTDEALDYVSIHFDCGQVDSLMRDGTVRSNDKCDRVARILRLWRKDKRRG